MSDKVVNEEVQKAWSDAIGRPVNFELLEVETHDGRKQTQLINGENGAIVCAVNLTGKDAVRKLVDNAGVAFLDPAFDVLEIEGPNQANQLDKGGAVARPSDRPGVAVEAEQADDAGALPEDRKTPAKKTATKTSSKSTKTPAKPNQTAQERTDKEGIQSQVDEEQKKKQTPEQAKETADQKAKTDEGKE